jgi:hypothetical protein
MNKRKQTTTKIIEKIIIFVFVVSLFSPILSIEAAASTSLTNLYNNPNQSGNNTYKFKISDVVNSGMLTSIVGCTGVVNKVASWMTSFVQSSAQQDLMNTANLNKVRAQLESACASTKASTEAGAGATPVVNDLTSTVKTIFAKIKVNVASILSTNSKIASTGKNGLQSSTAGKSSEQICLDQVKAIDPQMLDEMVKQTEQQKTDDLKTQCFDGIAIALAKNQLTAMTKSTMNWVNTGYQGNPFFVQNMTALTNGLQKSITQDSINRLTSSNSAYPYGSSFSKSIINTSALGSGASDFLGSMTSDLGNFITDPDSYAPSNAAQNAKDAVNRFANDFSTGGWNGWLALTQNEANNPLGFSMSVSQYLADQTNQQTQTIKDEVTQNNGFLSQKECVLWDIYNDDNELQYTNNTDEIVMTSTRQLDKNDKCDPNGWKIVTPGSIIKDKVTNYLNSPERQLELVKTINDSLNSLFSVLISKLEGGGLSGLSTVAVNTNTDLTSDTTTTSADGNSTYDNSGAYDGFNLTKDLGNTYIHDTVTSLGTWNANSNSTSTGKKLYPDIAPEVADGTISNNTYYTVNTKGNTKLITEGYNVWSVGDRAFWDGSKWQNWKKGQENPIKERGVIQIQQDYIVAAKEIMGVLPKVMTSLGELDYCIPGPNPSYKVNSTDAQSAYQDWIGSIYTGAKDGSDTNRMSWTIDRENSQTYQKLADIFNDNPNVWKQIRESNAVAWFLNYFGPFSGTNSNIVYYSYKGDDAAKYAEATNLQDINTNYVNNSLFQNFYEVFDNTMNKVYFNNMTKEYLDTETSIGVNKNPAYIPMAQSGLDLTKNITYYNDDTTEAIQNYTDAINQAKINIAKLNPIKTAVSAIIKAAQDRRDARLLEILKNESNRNGTPVLTAAQYKTKYAGCLDEENIQVFDADTITKASNTTAENCTDGIDNDLNGLADSADPACSNTNTNNNTTGITNTNLSTGTANNTYYKLMSCGDNQPYITGPYPNGTYNTGSKVQGSTNSYYVVTESGTTPIAGLTNIITSGTGLYGCLENNNSTTASTTPSVTYNVTINILGGGGSVYPSSIANINSGGSANFFVYPEAGRSISNLENTCGGISKTGTGGQYIINNITSNCTVSVRF